MPLGKYRANEKGVTTMEKSSRNICSEVLLILFAFYYKLKEVKAWDIYKIQNNINQKVYIGQTVAFYEKRFRQHRNNYTKPYFVQLALYKAFKKYGLHNFSFEVIEQVENSALDEREKY